MRNFTAVLFTCALAAGCGGVVGGDWSNGGSTHVETPDAGSSAATGGRVGTGGTTAATGGRVGTGGTTAATGGRVGTGGGTSSGGAAGGSPAVSGETVFVGDFETGTLSQWSYIERCQTDRILVYSTANAPAGAPAPRGGQYAVRFRVQNTDIEPCTSTDGARAELESPETLLKPGDERWEAWSVYIPSNHPTPKCGSCPNGDWMMFQEDYGAPFDGSASIAWFVDLTSTPNRFRMDRGEQYGHDSPAWSALVVDRWVDFLVHKKFANTTGGGGFVEAWVDGKPLTFEGCGTNCTKLMTQTMHATQKQLAFYLTSYRPQGLYDWFEIYYDEARVGTTRASVELK
jgi:hypothetical protein